MGFALFSTAQFAIAAKDALQEMVFDAESQSVLHIEMAKKNLFVKRGIVADSNAYDQSKRLRTGGDYSHSAYTTASPFHPPPAPVWGPHGYMAPTPPPYDPYGGYHVPPVPMPAPAPVPAPSSYVPVQNTKDNPPCNTLFIGNLTENINEEELRGLFSAQPGFKQMKILRQERHTVCFIEFEDVNTATNVHHTLQGAVIPSSSVGMRIQYSKNPFGKRKDGGHPGASPGANAVPAMTYQDKLTLTEEKSASAATKLARSNSGTGTGRNNLTGELPLEITELKLLKNISLFENQFSGVIPQSLGINASLQELDFTSNRFTGAIPPNLCFGKNLRVLNLGNNQLNGSVTADIGGCQTLWRLNLLQNNLTGVLPVFAENPNLAHMDISENKITGPIPSSLGNCTNITSIDLSMNRIVGFIPAELGNLAYLQSLDLSHNVLEGSLPSELSKCSKLEEFDVSFNSLNGSFPYALTSWKHLSTLILSENQFTGGIPSFLSEFEMLSELQLGGNSFGGKIPSSVGAMKNLIYALNLSSNGLTGEIPPELRNLFKLVRLDISHNNLTGTLTVLDGMDSLVEVNVSYNHFTGPIPETLMNSVNSSPSSFIGNPGLCIKCLPSGGSTCPRNNYLNPCENQSRSQKGLSRMKVAMIALGSSLATVVLLGVVILMFVFCRKRKKELEVCVEESPSPLLNEVMEATENLNDRIPHESYPGVSAIGLPLE
ncbi:hypothetical protein COLO4_22867 [Corchorus olitorius]|uniref:RRM domain-containing protein n=1 Tax=Corchorus olitorius TaxID=93759 RepID=A0A1R3IJG7_9ROSI|nr:hypothetical protein COLO4_22867 [Corchorus olitorius]